MDVSSKLKVIDAVFSHLHSRVKFSLNCAPKLSYIVTINRKVKFSIFSVITNNSNSVWLFFIGIIFIYFGM